MMKIAILATVVVLMSTVVAAAAEKSRVNIQAIEARSGNSKTGSKVDSKLAARLRATLTSMGMKKPDISSKVQKEKKLAVGDKLSLTAGSYRLEVVCKEVKAKSVSLTVTFLDIGGKKENKMSETTVELKGDQVLPMTVTDGKITTIFVVSRGD
jgi:hypothetical protein